MEPNIYSIKFCDFCNKYEVTKTFLHHTALTMPWFFLCARLFFLLYQKGADYITMCDLTYMITLFCLKCYETCKDILEYHYKVIKVKVFRLSMLKATYTTTNHPLPTQLTA